jgi:hypothetical protein
MVSQVHGSVSSQIREFRGFAGSRFQSFTGLRLRSFASSRFQIFTGSRLRSFADSRFQILIGSRLRSFAGSRFIPDLHGFNLPENLFHEFCEFPNSEDGGERVAACAAGCLYRGGRVDASAADRPRRRRVEMKDGGARAAGGGGGGGHSQTAGKDALTRRRRRPPALRGPGRRSRQRSGKQR